MVTRIMRHEWRLLGADRTLWVVVPLLAAIIGYGVYNGALWVRFQERTLRAAGEEEAGRHARAKAEIAEIERRGKQVQPFLDPRSAAVASGRAGVRYAAMPPAPLAALAVGQSDLYPYYFKVTRQSRQTFVSNDEIENPANLLSGRFDLAFVIIYLYPLLILALAYNLLSAEREQGTLAMMLSQPVALRTVALGKAGARALVVLLVAVGFSLAGFLLVGADLARGDVWWRLLLWVAVVALYGAFWFALAVAVNAWGKSSASNALMLAGLWLLFVLLVPSLLNVAVTAAYPVPSRVEMIQATRRASAEATARGSQVMARYFEDHPELAGDGAPDFNDFYTRSLALQEETERLVGPVTDYFDRQVLGQQVLVDRFRFLSPAVVTQAALNDLAGTSAERYRHFLSQVGAYHQSWKAYFAPRIVSKASLRPEDYDRAPAFAFREEPAAAVAARASVGGAGLLVATLLVAAAAVAALRRYRLA